MGMMGININTFVNEIKEDLEDEIYDPMIGIGKSGVGKTMSIYELTQELGIGFCELRLVTLGETDLLGIPDIKDGRTTYASNDLLPMAERDGERGILVLDEITSAKSNIRAAAYQLLDSKRALGNYKLPAGWKVVALGNGIDDGGVFDSMENAFLSRATCYRIEPDFDTWKKWAIKNGVNKSVIAYVQFEPDMMHKMEVDEIASVFPCPRSWTALSKKLNSREKKHGGILDEESVELYAAGAVGVEAASKFAAFYAYNSKTISPDDILSGKSKGTDIGQVEPQVVYLVIQSLISQLKKELEEGHKGFGEFNADCIKRAANAAKWAIDVSSVRMDYGITCIQDLSSSVDSFNEMVISCEAFEEECPELLEFANKTQIKFIPA